MKWKEWPTWLKWVITIVIVLPLIELIPGVSPIGILLALFSLRQIPFLALTNLLMAVIVVSSPILGIYQWGWKKGLFLGSVISLSYLWLIDFIIIKRFIPRCTDWCGIENIILTAPLVILTIIGFLLFYITLLVDTYQEKKLRKN